MTETEWRKIKPFWFSIIAALQKAGMPAVGFDNFLPSFDPGYEPQWDKVIKIAKEVSGLAVKPVAKKPAPKKKRVKKGG